MSSECFFNPQSVAYILYHNEYDHVILRALPPSGHPTFSGNLQSCAVLWSLCGFGRWQTHLRNKDHCNGGCWTTGTATASSRFGWNQDLDDDFFWVLMNGWMVEPDFFVFFFWGGSGLGWIQPISYSIDQMCQDQILKILKSRESTTETKSNAWDSRKKCHSYWPIGSMGLVYLPTWMVDFIWSVGRYTIHGSYGLCNCNISFLVSTLFRDRSCMAAVSTDRGWSQWLDFAVLWQHDASGHANRRGWSLYRLMSFCLGGLAFCRLVCGQSCVNYECWMIFFAPWASIRWYHQGGVEHYIVSFGVWLVDRFFFPNLMEISCLELFFWLWAALWDVVIEIVILMCRRC